MRSLRAATRLSIRRSRNRDLVILALARHERMTLHEVSRATGLPPYRVEAVLMGDGVDYAFDLSLIELGIANAVRTRFGKEFEITEKGRFEAAVLGDARDAARLL